MNWSGAGIAALAGCLDHDVGGTGDEYVAMQSDFADYASWTRFDIEAETSSPGEGPRTVYISELPAASSASFPVGTRIVKVAETDPDPAAWLMVAMAKRGGNYNADGAVGWEWFDIDPSSTGTPLIEWRGPVPPEGSGYECALGDSDTGQDAAIGDCNTCHAAAWQNDYVMSDPLDLGSL